MPALEPLGAGTLRAAAVLVGCVVALAGCAQLLPHEKYTVAAPFDSYAAAQQALEQVVPFETTVDELRGLGFDLQASANVTLIPYPALVARLAPNPSVPFAELDRGIRDCILARAGCRAFEIRIVRERRRREGAFWEDFLNFRRTTEVTGWKFEALFVVSDGVVLFRNHGGVPRVARTEQRSNPLGPLQPSGEGLGGLIR